MSGPKISVIIPVYKVENTLRCCLDSVIGQTWDNLEIILVDDGSPDACGAICDDYAAKDARIVVIHQANQGVSQARNAALDRATGTYIGFVDSDDWIEPDMFARMLAAMREENAAIAICGWRLLLPRRKLCFGTDRLQSCDSMQGLELLFSEAWFRNFVWNKLFRTELFADVRFPAGKFFEELPVIYKLFERAFTIALCPFVGYNHIRRDNSTIGVRRLRNELDACEHHIARYLDVAGRYPQFARSLISGMLETFLRTIFIGLRNTAEERRAGQTRRRAISAFLTAHATELDKHLTFFERRALCLIRANTMFTDYVVACWHVCRKVMLKISTRFWAACAPQKGSDHV